MRTLDASTTTALGEDITQPYYLVFMDFTTPLYYSSTTAISWDSETWAEAPIEVGGSSISVFNADKAFGQVVLADGTAGRAIKIYQGYANDSAHPNPVLILDGEMSDATIADYVTVNIKQIPPLRSPRHYSGPPVMNHLPRAGTRFETPKGIITLEGN